MYKRPMLEMLKLSGETIWINPDHILSIEGVPDTIVTLTNGEKITTQDSVETLTNRFTQYKKEIHA